MTRLGELNSCDCDRRKEYCILKFRSMYERPESYQGAKVTAQDDPRITPVDWRS